MSFDSYWVPCLMQVSFEDFRGRKECVQSSCHDVNNIVSKSSLHVGAVEKSRIVKNSPKGLLYSAGLRGFIKERKDKAGTIGTYMWPDSVIFVDDVDDVSFW